MDYDKEILKSFPDEIGFFTETKAKLNKTLKQQNESVDYHDREYREFQQYMADSRAELDPHEMFQNSLLLNQTDNYGAIAVRMRDTTAKIIESPYFARIDFCAADRLEASKYYIGRFSFSYKNELLILDWRTPAASMFYDFEIGDAEYIALAGKVSGKLIRKRQFKINKGVLEYVLESSVSIRDDILQRELSSTSDEKMKIIISTLQKEQNAIIRNERAHTLIIQGVAGSGKTSIALHRLAYLLYRHKEQIKAKNLTIISPNKVFADFISGVLPELGEEPILGSSFFDLAKVQLNGIINFNPESDTYEIENTPAAERIKLKASKEFLTLLDNYLFKMESEIFKPGGYSFGSFRVPADWVSARYFAYKKLPVIKRLKTIAGDIYDYFQRENYFNDALPAKGAIFNNLKKGLKFNSTLALYKDFYAKNNLSDKLLIKNKTLEWADVFPFLYCHAFFEGLKQSEVIRHLVIDEMQDYTPVQYAVINKLFPCKKTILGDFGQTVNPNHNYSLADLTAIYGGGAELIRLNKSYRSSYEIMTFAKAIGCIEELEAVERHGEKPAIISCKDNGAQSEQLKAMINRFIGSKRNTLGIIVKTNRAARELYENLSAEYDIKLISAGSEKFENGISVTSVQMSKGLEFDEVIVPFTDSENYQTLHDRNLLYIACTRAMHRLTLMHCGGQTKWLDSVKHLAGFCTL